MSVIRNVFVKSKMNKDLDERLLPSGEYRDGRNISINKSEGPDEGVVENIIGNNIYSNFNFGTGVEIIGTHVDTDKDRIFIFATNHSDSSPTTLDAPAVGNVQGVGKITTSAKCIIAYIEGPTSGAVNVPKHDKLVDGAFLNFSKTHPITGIDIIEDLLFFTDDRNQPRKINIEKAIAESATSGSPYYTTEDHISVSKLSPVDPIDFIYQVGGAFVSGLLDETSEYLPANSSSTLNANVPSPGQLKFNTNNPQLANNIGKIRFKNLNFPELGYFDMVNLDASDIITYQYPIGSTNTPSQSLTAANAAAVVFKGSPGGVASVAFLASNVLQFERENPIYDANYSGDKDYLRNKFIRFSYRFKYDDGEYSLMAPFTQHAFVPKQFGYFLDSASGTGELKRDEKDTAESGINKLMENQVTSAKFRIEMPYKADSPLQSRLSEFKKDYKVESIQILLKESDGLAIKVVDEIDTNSDSGFGPSDTGFFFEYNYKSEKPFKVLPDADATRIHDKVPIRALAQAVTSNRVVYANFIEKHESPDFLQYDISVAAKPQSSSTSFDQKEYPNHTLKQNRSYKVGVVLVDRYGRSSNVILRNPTTGVSVSGEFASIYSPYENLATTLNWPGNNLNLLFNSVIPQVKNTTGYPGVWSPTNPLGFYSYKIVVQQKQQEYYNVYVPGACSGKITFNGKLGSSTIVGDKPTYERANSFSNIVLYGDNINKIPKELADVGPTEEIYGSETLLYPRVVTRYIVDQTNSPTAYNPVLSSTESSQVRQLNEFNVASIISFNDLGSWTAQSNNTDVAKSSYPNNSPVTGTTVLKYVDPLYRESSKNPFVAQLSTNFLVGFAPSVQAGNLDLSPRVIPQFSKNLNIFETDAVISNIDIFWESSSAGRISTLNSDITSGTAGLVNGISEPNLLMNESITPGVNSSISDTFNVIDDSGGTVAGSTATMNVTNGNNSPVSMFQLVESPAAPAYEIIYNPTDAGVYYGSNANQRTFNFNITTSTSTGASVNNTYQMLLGNSAPSLISPLPKSGEGGSGNSGSGVIMLFDGNNGAASGSNGSFDTPFFIQGTTSPNTGQGFPGCEVIRLQQYSQVFNGSGSTVSGIQQQEVSLSNIAGSVNSQQLFLRTSSNPHVFWNIQSDFATLSNLQNSTGDVNPATSASVNGRFLFKVEVLDAGGIGQGMKREYSAWFQILNF